MIQLNPALFSVFTVLLAIFGSVVTVAVAWGALKSKLEGFASDVKEIAADVKELGKQVNRIDRDLGALNERTSQADRAGGQRAGNFPQLPPRGSK